MVVLLRRVLLVGAVLVVLTATGAASGVPVDVWWASTPGPLPQLITGALVASGAAMAYPKVAMFLIAFVTGLVLLGRAARWVRRRNVTKDPQRLYTTAQRNQGFARSGGRCEMEGVFFFRCRGPAEHGDHWFPWSKGGATDMANFVAGCARCNIAKSNKIPTFWETQRLAYRRRSYFPDTSDPTPGSRYAR